MNNLRILAYNVADRATITAADTASGMGTDKLKTDIKGEVCRILNTTATIALNWPDLETIAAIVIPASNLGPSSTIRVRAYSDSAGMTLVGDTGVKFAAPGTIMENWDFYQTLNVNAFSDGVAPITACYLPEAVAARKIVIDLENPDNTFIDISRLIAGAYHETTYTADYGAVVALQDMTKNSRAASGDIKSEWGPKSNVLTFDLSWIDSTDRERFRQLIARGIGRSLFVSLLPENTDPVLERDYSIYGKPAQAGSMTFAFYNTHTSKISIESF